MLFLKVGKDVAVIPQESLGAKGCFFVGGTYQGETGNRFLSGQMFVEVYVPKVISQKYPLILFHGAGQTNVNWLSAVDGGMGWADYFVGQGYIVYLAEQPARGRSAYHPEVDGKTIYGSLEKLEARFTSNEGEWERSRLHTQWPENGRKIGTALFDQFAATQVEYLPSNKQSQKLIQNVAGALLEKTGSAILLTHSQAGPFGWNIADEYPEQVKGIIALEPSGPPFSEDLTDFASKNYGISDLPLHYDPPVDDIKQFELEMLKSRQEKESDGWVMKEPARQLPNLQGIPIAIIVSEASYHTQYDHLTSYVLNQSGVKHDFIRLEDQGIYGNGHMMMLEKNNLDIAAFVSKWISEHIV